MTTEQALTTLARAAATIVWVVYLISILRSHSPHRLRESIIAVVVVAYAGAFTWRAVTSPGTVLIEFTVVVVFSLMVGVALLWERFG